MTPKQREERKRRVRWSYLVGCRDNFTCRICSDDQETVDIRSHHIEGFAFNRELRFDVANGVTLCVTCHDLYHKTFMGGNRVPATRETFDQFVCFLWSLALLVNNRY